MAVVVTEAESVAGIAAAVVVGDAVADAIAEAARRVAQACAICLPRNMHHHKVASPVDLIIAAHSRAVTITGVRKLRAAPGLR